jgi:2'-5' RNA ligase
MTRRVIVLEPTFHGIDLIERFRSRFDPIHTEIPAHITLVFPFESDLTTDALLRHIQSATAGLKPFQAVLQGITGDSGEYLFLNVKQGNDPIIALHDRLYTGPLASFLRTDLTYTPHMTIGRVTPHTGFLLALAAARQELTIPFTMTLDTLTVFEGWPAKLRRRELQHRLQTTP